MHNDSMHQGSAHYLLMNADAANRFTQPIHSFDTHPPSPFVSPLAFAA
jgi:hypothetical protein